MGAGGTAEITGLGRSIRAGTVPLITLAYSGDLWLPGFLGLARMGLQWGTLDINNPTYLGQARVGLAGFTVQGWLMRLLSGRIGWGMPSPGPGPAFKGSFLSPSTNH